MPDRIDTDGKDTNAFPKWRMVALCVVLVLMGAGLVIYQKFESEAAKQRETTSQTSDVQKPNLEAGGSLESLFLMLQKDRDSQRAVTPSPVAIPTPSAPMQVYVTHKPQQQIQAPDDELVKLGTQLRQTKVQALQATSHVGGFVERQGQPQANVSQQQPNVPQGSYSELLGSAGGQSAASDPNAQNAKQDFLYSQGGQLTPQGYSPNVPIPQQFPYELKAGTVIPGIMISGVNSDLPGAIIGQVSENVYDTATGKYVLIPKGSRLIGVYDSKVTYGQNRVAIVWNRVIAPNGTSLNIAGSPGMDRAGYSGMAGKVNEHWGRLISAALLASMFVAGAEIINPSDTADGNNSNKKSPRDVAAESVANTVLEIGARLIEKNSNIQPTIKIRPGARFNVFVLQDVVFPEPWR